MHSRLLSLFAGFALAAASQAQTATTVVHTDSRERPFAVVENSSMRYAQGDWNPDSSLFRYIHDHPDGDYVIFAQDGGVYRLDGAQTMVEVKQLYAPLIELSVKQEALAHAQQKLAAQQEKLARSQGALAGGQQRIARQQPGSSPEAQGDLGRGQGTIGQTQGELGAAQGAIGQEQGELGTAQGELGHQQGEIARSAGKRLQQIFSQCLADGSCHRAA